MPIYSFHVSRNQIVEIVICADSFDTARNQLDSGFYTGKQTEVLSEEITNDDIISIDGLDPLENADFKKWSTT